MALFRCASGSSGGGATITVTYSSDFYGETVTCSHGTKTYSKVATSSGTLEFSVDEEGTWTISCTIGSDTFSTTADVDLSYDAELVSLPNGETVLPTDDIETWLACAAITDKAYTTLSQVLGDSETYNALLGDSNACAYMKRSTTWSTDICASQYAMNLLGQYDTACDALLSDSTWASAIANSTYFESVLNVKVPTMTSNTTPSGECSGSSYKRGDEYYRAFDKNDTSYWSPTNGNPSGSYIIYMFDQPVTITKLSIKNYLNYGVQSATLYASNTGENDYIAIKSDIALSDTASYQDVIIENNNAYKYWKLLVNSGYNSGELDVFEIQFYGRKSSGEKIHGANGESAYILDGGSPVTITDPSTLDAGTYTVYSRVAKDPANLSNDYSKTIRICPNTKEIVLMPDAIILYWYGYIGNMISCTIDNGWADYASEPTYNTNSIHIATDSSSYSAEGVASESKIITTKAHWILKSYGDAWYGLGTTNSIGNNTASGSNGGVFNDSDTSIHHATVTPINASTASYVWCGMNYALNREADLYAMWYE